MNILVKVFRNYPVCDHFKPKLCFDIGPKKVLTLTGTGLTITPIAPISLIAPTTPISLMTPMIP